MLEKQVQDRYGGRETRQMTAGGFFFSTWKTLPGIATPIFWLAKQELVIPSKYSFVMYFF